MRTLRVRNALTILLASLLSVAALTTPTHPGRSLAAPQVLRGSASSGTYFDYFVFIIMENHNLCQILTSCGGTASYMSGLANSYGSATGDRYCNVNPSLPNYLCLTGGSNFGCAGYDGNPNSNACTAQAWNAPNIVDRLESAGLTWKAYMQDMPSNCYASDAGSYAVRHDPFVYYSGIANDSARCSRVVPSGSSDSALLQDLGSTSRASNYMWFTPNTCNDMHDCGVSTGDTYLSGLVPQMLQSTIFSTQRAALLITFDEGYGEPVYTAWAGPVVKTNYTSAFAYTHFSVLATIESNWNLTPLTSNDRDAPNMNEFFSGTASRPQPPSENLFLYVGLVALVAVVALAAILTVRRRRKRPKTPESETDKR